MHKVCTVTYCSASAQLIALFKAEVFKVLNPTIRKSLLNFLSQAYVGGLYREQGLDVVRKWLRSLLLSDVKEAYEIVRREHLLPPSGL